nr:MAG TPA: hypothetical protein [Caudoviricetes sp.]
MYVGFQAGGAIRRPFFILAFWQKKVWEILWKGLTNYQIRCII